MLPLSLRRTAQSPRLLELVISVTQESAPCEVSGRTPRFEFVNLSLV